MLTTDNIKHMLNVARQCYEIARAEDFSESEARNAFMMGLLHDIGKEFDKEDHANTSYEMIKGFIKSKDLEKYINSIRLHGKVCAKASTLQDMLNYADMITMPNGDISTLDNRLYDIGNRYGIESDTYLESKELVEYLKNTLGDR